MSYSGIYSNKPPEWVTKRLLEDFNYDFEKGEMYWKPGKGQKKGPLGHPHKGKDLYVSFKNPDGKSWNGPVARILWFMKYGVWPHYRMTWLDGNNKNCSIRNLQAEGLIGHVSWDKTNKKWVGIMPLGHDSKQTTVIVHDDEDLVRRVMIQMARVCRQREDALFKRMSKGKNGWYDSYGDNSITSVGEG